jgi:hypothetical protein
MVYAVPEYLASYLMLAGKSRCRHVLPAGKMELAAELRMGSRLAVFQWAARPWHTSAIILAVIRFRASGWSESAAARQTTA